MATPAPRRSGRSRTPSSRVLDGDNEGEMELSNHRAARRAVTVVVPTNSAASRATSAEPAADEERGRSGYSGPLPLAEVSDDDDELEPRPRGPSKRPRRVVDSDDDKDPDVPKDDDANPAAQTPATGSKDDDTSDEEAPPKKKQQRGRQDPPDVKAHFHPAVAMKGVGGVTKDHRRCMPCEKAPESKRKVTYIVDENSTLRRHLEAFHKQTYNGWCEKTGFESKLPKAIKARKRAAEEEAAGLQQSTLNGKFKPATNRLKYSETAFREAAQDWLIATNQPLEAVDHPKFRDLINLASCAPAEGINIPDKRATQADIIERFERTVSDLADHLNSDKVQGEVSLTTDAWQAGNRDAYVAITGHWVEEHGPGDWRLQAALLGFTQLKASHSGANLGRALYNVCKRYRIEHKVGWVTTDNTTNNDTMLTWFEGKLSRNQCRRRARAARWTKHTRHIRCLAHIINLATQALLAKYSKTPHLSTDSSPDNLDKASTSAATNSAPADDDHDDGAAVLGALRDEVGLVRLITVKARSSAKRTELLKELQSSKGVKIPLNLLLDMKVRWSSTYAMLKRALDLRLYINKFIIEIASEELASKQDAIFALRVTDEEWARVEQTLAVLQHAESAQHTFSTETEPALANALPALEKLHKTWTRLTTKAEYARHHDAITEGLNKIATYYNKSSSVPAYNISMVLNPDLKLGYFRKKWAKNDEAAAKEDAETAFRERWQLLNDATVPKAQPLASTSSKSMFDLSDDDDDTTTTSPLGENEPWRKEWVQYVEGHDELAEGQSLVNWWGLNARRLPTWASLARDYLAIMASLVSSERAFSGAGITISKRHNRLKADIVEALQVLRSLINTDLIYREPDRTGAWELEHEDDEQAGPVVKNFVLPEVPDIDLSLVFSDLEDSDDEPMVIE